jgi:hypothetical protein
MPARIVLVHDDPEFRECAVTALQDAGHDVRVFSGSMEAIDALEVGRVSASSRERRRHRCRSRAYACRSGIIYLAQDFGRRGGVSLLSAGIGAGRNEGSDIARSWPSVTLLAR